LEFGDGNRPNHALDIAVGGAVIDLHEKRERKARPFGGLRLQRTAIVVDMIGRATQNAGDDGMGGIKE
jgi:hypothetical protein